MTSGRGYRDLVVWQKAMALVKLVYEHTRSLPDEEKFGLVTQMRRAAVSIPSNIAEGQGRSTPGEFRQFLGNARGSLYELETQVTIANDLGYIERPPTETMLELIGLVARLLNGLRSSLAKSK